MSAQLNALRRIISSDKRFVSFKDLVDCDNRFSLPIDEWRTEANLLHGQRQVKKLSHKDPQFARKLIAAVTTEVGARSRLCEMLSRSITVNKLYKDYIEALKDHMSITYSQQLASALKTAKEREQFVNKILSRYSRQRLEIECFVDELNIYIQDIDKAGYGVKAMADVFIAVFRAEGRVDI